LVKENEIFSRTPILTGIRVTSVYLDFETENKVYFTKYLYFFYFDNGGKIVEEK
jgi:hypothetical protein